MEIEVAINGLTPLILNRFSDAAALSASSGTRSAAAAPDRGTALEIAKSKLYYGLEGQLVVPQPNLLRCLVEGGRFTKAGRKQITTNKESLLYACVDIAGVTVDIIHDAPWVVDTRPVRIPATGGRILAHRPMFHDWRLEFVVELDEEMVSAALFRQIVDDAGRRIGLGDYRPSTKGPFGKFRVDRWVEHAQTAPEKLAAQ